MPWVTITFRSDHPDALEIDWPRELGLLQHRLWDRLRIERDTVEVVVVGGDEPRADTAA